MDSNEQGSGEASLGVGLRMDASSFPDYPAWATRIEGTSSLLHVLPSRTRNQPKRQERPDWRKTVRHWQRLGHVSLNYHPKVRHEVPGRIVVLWDVSGSMSDSTDLYLPWLYALRRKWKRLGVFPFATRMADISEALRAPYNVVRALLAEVEHVWSGGTNIGWALQEWIRLYGDTWLRSDTVVMVLSDGWDVGTPEDVEAALHTMRARDARIIWANPWMGTPGFKPKTRALRAALPYLERMVPARNEHDLISLSND